MDEIRLGTVKELEDWELGGAKWRAIDLSDERAVVELCACTGEPMDMVQSQSPEFIEFVRAHPRD